jgi:hypothetical protein
VGVPGLARLPVWRGDAGTVRHHVTQGSRHAQPCTTNFMTLFSRKFKTIFSPLEELGHETEQNFFLICWQIDINMNHSIFELL